MSKKQKIEIKELLKEAKKLQKEGREVSAELKRLFFI